MSKTGAAMTVGFARTILLSVILTLWIANSGLCQVGDKGPRYEYGLSLLGGVGEESDVDIEYYSASPRWGWLLTDRWALELEGNFGHYRLDSTDMSSIGFNGLLVYEFLKRDRWSAIITGGAGLFYLDLDKRPELEDSDVLGLAQAGVGLKLFTGDKSILRLEYRFHHMSDPFNTNDGGLNYHCIVLGISFIVY